MPIRIFLSHPIRNPRRCIKLINPFTDTEKQLLGVGYEDVGGFQRPICYTEEEFMDLWPPGTTLYYNEDDYIYGCEYDEKYADIIKNLRIVTVFSGY